MNDFEFELPPEFRAITAVLCDGTGEVSVSVTGGINGSTDTRIVGDPVAVSLAAIVALAAASLTLAAGRNDDPMEDLSVIVDTAKILIEHNTEEVK